ncbi:MAG: flagellar hook-basal body complex protein [Magnetococcales bacterium]|nr:flagellar hook-basal body complex protein [Magnetococcales bacterium]
MSITQAMYAGASALTNFSESITVIGNNLANSNTTAFKSSSASFEDVLIQTVGNSGAGGSTQVGTGTGLAGVRQDMTQGSFAPSANVTDLSIDGRGFFKVRSAISSTSAATTATNEPEVFYTRAGSFRKEKEGNLVNTGGLILQGYALNESGERGGQMVDVNLAGFDRAPPSATTLVTAHVNLDSTTQAIMPSLVPVTPTNPGDPLTYVDAAAYNPNQPSTYNFSTAVRIFDSQGVGHSMELQFRKLPMKTPATVVGNGGTAAQQVTLNLSGEGGVTLTFTPTDSDPANPDQTKIFRTVVDLPAGVSTLALSNLAAEDGNGTPQDVAMHLALTNGKLYRVTAEPSNSEVVVSRLAGDDGRDAVTVGADNDSTWEWHAVVNRRELESGRPDDSTLEALVPNAALKPAGLPSDSSMVPTSDGYYVGRLEFDRNGLLKREGSVPLTVQFRGAESQQVLFDFGRAVGTLGDSTNDFFKEQPGNLVYKTATSAVADTSSHVGTSSVQVAGSSSTTKLDQDGYPTGIIDKISISPSGVITGSYTNSQTKRLFQIGLVDFPDEGALDQKGGNLFAETKASGQPLEGTPGSGRLGATVAYSLEQSNVDMSGEFVRMIATQRGFQANSRIVTVVDGMMEELLSLKR